MARNRKEDTLFFRDGQGKRVASVTYRGAYVVIAGKEYDRTPFGYERHYREETVDGKPVRVMSAIADWNTKQGLNLNAVATECYNCGAKVGDKVGELHRVGCKAEECPACRKTYLANQRGNTDIPCKCILLPSYDGGAYIPAGN